MTISMTEYLTEAIVLAKEPAGEYDARVVLYTKNLGKITAKAISARKITSKLNAHLEPLNLTVARLVYKNEYRITDALTINRFLNSAAAFKLLNFIKEMTGEGESDYQLWTVLLAALRSGAVSYDDLLRVLGFNPQYALCDGCSGRPDHFSVENLSFWCQNCRQKSNARGI